MVIFLIKAVRNDKIADKSGLNLGEDTEKSRQISHTCEV